MVGEREGMPRTVWGGRDEEEKGAEAEAAEVGRRDEGEEEVEGKRAVAEARGGRGQAWNPTL
jgi:hypothetical protein